MVSRIPVAELTTNLTDSPVDWRRWSATTGLRGSAEATVSTPPSIVIGQIRYWRRYLADTFLSTGTVDGNSSRQTYGRSCCTASARATSSSLTAPRATKASPSNSPVVRWRAGARVAAPGVAHSCATEVVPGGGGGAPVGS